ncbi:MAG: FAD-dependent oxidoreductase [Nitrososphaerota archaeon]|nr:FAD-dependent oxidoreductase [Nitrososphaerota archaeon]
MSAIVEPKRVGGFPFPKSDPAERKKDFSEVQQPYTTKLVMLEADRCLRCGTPVCIDACPVHLDVRGMNDAVARGDFGLAYRRIRETNALPGVTARCCPQLMGLCEDACVMRWQGEPIAIGMIQRFVADQEQNESRQPDPKGEKDTGKRVSVVGAGPAGLAAAELLRRYGHSVTVYEELRTAGGTAWYAIPDYHLPKDVLMYEIVRIKGQGVDVRTGVKVGDETRLSDLLDDSDAVLVTTGCKDVMKLDTPGADLKGVYQAYDFLEDVFVDGVDEYMKHPGYDLGREVAVIGGGDSALDAARTALRLTGGRVTIYYRRTEKEMPADPLMLQEASEEGVGFRYLAAPKSYGGRDGRLTGVTMYAMQLGDPDPEGRRSPVPVPGKEFEVPCDSVILAIGRGPNSYLQRVSGLKTGKRGSVLVDDRFGTSIPRVFAAGDVTTGETLVVKAMGSGREAAQRVHEYLMGLEDRHVSLYEEYYTRRSFERMEEGEEEEFPPP